MTRIDHQISIFSRHNARELVDKYMETTALSRKKSAKKASHTRKVTKWVAELQALWEFHSSCLQMSFQEYCETVLKRMNWEHLSSCFAKENPFVSLQQVLVLAKSLKSNVR
jgi:hypothetical protein